MDGSYFDLDLSNELLKIYKVDWGFWTLIGYLMIELLIIIYVIIIYKTIIPLNIVHIYMYIYNFFTLFFFTSKTWKFYELKIYFSVF